MAKVMYGKEIKYNVLLSLCPRKGNGAYRYGF
jgi:hypothetical protein